MGVTIREIMSLHHHHFDDCCRPAPACNELPRLSAPIRPGSPCGHILVRTSQGLVTLVTALTMLAALEATTYAKSQSC